MTQPTPPPTAIPGLITAAGITPATPPQPVQPVPVQQAAPVVISSAVAPAPVADPQIAPPAPLPTALFPPATVTSVNVPATVPGLATATVPGLNPPAPVAAPAPPAVPDPAPPVTGEQQDRGYPQGTPLEQMSGEQREAYWKYHARQWEARSKEKADYDAVKAKAGQYDQLVASQATDQEKAIAAARAEGERVATGRAAIVLVDAHVRAGLQQRLQPHQVEALASNLNHNHFLGPDGLTVDAAKVATFVDTVAPQQIAAPAATAPAASAAPGALPVGVPIPGSPGQPVTGLPRTLPDLGQGAQTSAPLDKLEAGRQQARAFLAGGGYR